MIEKVLLSLFLAGHCVLYATAAELDLRSNEGIHELPFPLSLNLRAQQGRDQRSLLNTFPFNQANQEEHHAHHEETVEASSDLLVPNSFQGSGGANFAEVAAAEVDGATGKRCIDKVEMQEETVYDDVVQCDHSYDKRCHTTYTTSYTSQQEEECDENFRKNCFIQYDQIAFNETVQICRQPLIKDCKVEGPEVCRTEYESECWTKQEEHEVEDDVVECTTVNDEKCEDETSGYTTSTKCTSWPREECTVAKKKVKKYTPITGCTKEPKELCAPAGCGFTQGAEECYDKVQTVVQDAPKEECTLEPQRTCKHVTKLVPKLEPSEECVDVPKEVCTRSKVNPRKIKTPVIKKWCYVPQVAKIRKKREVCIPCACAAMKDFAPKFGAFTTATASFSGDFEGFDKIVGAFSDGVGGLSPALGKLVDGVNNFNKGFEDIDNGVETFEAGLKDLDTLCGKPVTETVTITIEVKVQVMVSIMAGYEGMNSGIRACNNGYGEVSTGLNRLTSKYRGNPLLEPVKEGYSALREQFSEFTEGVNGLKDGFNTFGASFHGEDNSGLL